MCVNDSHFPQTAKVVLNLGLAGGNPRLVEGIDFAFVVQINGLDVEWGGLDRVRHTSSIVDPFEVKVKGQDCRWVHELEMLSWWEFRKAGAKMDFRVEEEIRVIQQVVKHFFGPCLMCDRETEYGNKIPRLGMNWLRKQFEPVARLRNVKAVRIGVAPKARSLAVLEALICKDCQAGLLKVRWAAASERDVALQRRVQLRNRSLAAMDAQQEREGTF